MALVMRLMAALLLWAAGFSALYAVHGLGCGLGWGDWPALPPFTRLNLVLVPLWLLFLVLALLLLRREARRHDLDGRPAIRRAVLAASWAGLVGLVFMGAPVLLPAHCL